MITLDFKVSLNLKLSDYRNIINRVTGDNPSAVLGTIESRQAFPNANLYLMNPNGIVFGQNARLDIGGSFHATTGTGLGFENGTFNVDKNSLTFPSGDPKTIRFAVSQPAGLINQDNLAIRQPLLRSPREEFAIGVSTAFENSGSYFGDRSFNFQNFKFDDGRSQSRVLRLSQDYLSRDPSGAWVLRSTFNMGLNVLGATIRNDASPDGRFFYWGGQVLRVQHIGTDRDTLAFFRLNMQFSGDQLLSLNRFSIGGAQSIRGYRQNQLTGDNGVQASVELQFPVARDEEGLATVKLLPFVEAGTIWNSSCVNSTNQSLIGLGLGATYQPMRNLLLRLDYGIPLVNVSNSGNNLQDSGLYFSINANF